MNTSSQPPPPNKKDPQRVRMCKGERTIGAAKGKQTSTMASCPPPPPPWAFGHHDPVRV